MATRSEVLAWVRSLADHRTGVDADGAFGMQCVDLPNMIAIKFFGRRLMGNGIQMSDAARGNGWPVVGSGRLKAGAITTISVAGNGYGHTGVVVEDERADGTMLCVEQNYATGGGGGPAVYVRRSHSQHGETIVSWFYPPYSDGIGGDVGSISVGTVNHVTTYIGGPTMHFIFNIKNDNSWNPGTLFFYNGSINSVQGIHNEEELKYLQSVYKDTTKMGLKSYTWDAKIAPVYVRVFGVLQPDGNTKAIKDALAKILKEIQDAT